MTQDNYSSPSEGKDGHQSLRETHAASDGLSENNGNEGGSHTVEPGVGTVEDEALLPTEAEEEAPSLLDQMGGLSGLVATTLPIVVYVPANSFLGLKAAIFTATGVAALVFIWRLIRKETLQPAVSGFIGVILCAAIAWFMGDAKGFFLYGIWMSLLYAVIFLISIVIRWPAVGVVWKGLKGDGFGWRRYPRARRYYDGATVAWALVFIARFFIQNHLYNAASTTALGVVKILMGWPLTAVVLLITIWAIRKADGIIEEATAHGVGDKSDGLVGDGIASTNEKASPTEEKVGPDHE